jgi:hypothetical protein
MLEYNRMRFVFQDVMLTRDNLKRRKWQGDSRSKFCDCAEEESIQHFFGCAIPKYVWSISFVLGVNCAPESFR